MIISSWIILAFSKDLRVRDTIEIDAEIFR